MATSRNMTEGEGRRLDEHMLEEDREVLHTNESSSMRVRQLREALEREQDLLEKRRNREKEVMQRKLIEDAEHLRRQRDAIDYEEMLLVRKSKELTDFDMKRLRYQREAIEKDQRTLERRRKMEENEMQKRLAEDAECIRKQREIIEREERLIKRQQIRDGEQKLEQLKSLKKSEEYEQSKGIHIRIPPTQTHSVGFEDSFQSKRGAVGGSQSQQDSYELFVERTEDRDKRIRDMTESELQAQMRMLQTELHKRNKGNDSFLPNEQSSQGIMHGDNEREVRVTRRQTGYQRDETEGVNDESKLSSGTKEQQNRTSDDSELITKQTNYVTVDTTKDSIKVPDTANVNRRIFKSDEDKENTSSGIIFTLDKEIDEMDDWLKRLKEESLRLKQSQGYGDFENNGHENIAADHVQRQLDRTYIDKKKMESEIKDDMRSTPKCPEEQIKRETYNRYKYNEPTSMYDTYRDSENMLKVTSDRPKIDSDKEVKPHKVGFVKDEDTSDDKLYHIESGYLLNRDRIGERNGGLSLDKENSFKEIGERLGHGDYQFSTEREKELRELERIKSLRHREELRLKELEDTLRGNETSYTGGQESNELERVKRLKQREERIKGLEEAFLVKEKEMESKRIFLEQQLDAQRKIEYMKPDEKEILLREEKLKEKFHRMKEKERELEILETSLKQSASTNAKAKPENVLLEKDEKKANSRNREAKQYISEEELKRLLLSDKGTYKISKAGESMFAADLTAISRKDVTDQSKDTEGKISLEKNIFFPKFTPFSGDDSKPKGEATYEEWRYEVKCTRRDKVYPENVIGQAIRKSLRGPAKREIVQMGPSASVEDIMERLESTFGNVASGMSVLQEFFTASQKQEETVAAWGLRLEEIMQNAIDKGHIQDDEKDDLLKDKFWRSLRSERLKNATRIDFRTISNFKQLVKAVRTEELSMKANANAQQQTVTTNVSQKEEKDEKKERSTQEQMFQALLDLQKEIKQYNRRRGRGRPWNQQQYQQQRNQGSQQQRNQQQSNQNQGNKQENQQEKQQGQPVTQNSDGTKNLNM